MRRLTLIATLSLMTLSIPPLPLLPTAQNGTSDVVRAIQDMLAALDYLRLFMVLVAIIAIVVGIYFWRQHGSTTDNNKQTTDAIITMSKTITSAIDQNNVILRQFSESNAALLQLTRDNLRGVQSFIDLTTTTTAQQAEIAQALKDLKVGVIGAAHYDQTQATLLGKLGDLGSHMDQVESQVNMNGDTIKDVVNRMEKVEAGLQSLTTEVGKPNPGIEAMKMELQAVAAGVRELLELMKRQTAELPAVPKTDEPKGN